MSLLMQIGYFVLELLMRLHFRQTRHDVMSFQRSEHSFNLIDKYALYIHFPRINITSDSAVG